MSYESEAIAAMVEGVSNITAVQRSSAGVKPPGQTLRIFNGLASIGAQSVIITLYTPTTGKNYYITDVNMSSDAVATLGNVDVQLYTGTSASVVFRGSIHNLAPLSMVAIESQPQAFGNQTLNILVASVATTPLTPHLWYNVFGWEE